MPFQRVLVALDGSVCSARALQVAAALATTLGAQIGLVHVIDPKLVLDSGIPADQMWTLLRREGQELLDTAAAAIPAHAHPWKFLCEGQPAQKLLAAAHEWHAPSLSW